MNAEFNWWLLLVGVVAGAALTWLVLASSTREEHDVTEEESAAEAGWIAMLLGQDGEPVDAETARRVLEAHRAYLGLPPPDALVEPDAFPPSEGEEALATPPEIGTRDVDRGPATVGKAPRSGTT